MILQTKSIKIELNYKINEHKIVRVYMLQFSVDIIFYSAELFYNEYN